MSLVQIERTKLEGVLIVTPKRFPDSRGFFSESWNRRQMAEHGLDHDWVQDNHSMSHQLGTLRCLLYTSPSPRDLSTSRMPSSA